MANQGIYGSDVRTEVKNPLSQNLGQAQQPNSISLSGVSGPKGANFSQVGESQRVIAKLLGDGAGLLDSYIERNRTQWELDGKMAYAQGKSEKEMFDAGNKYSTAGFRTMQVQTAASQFVQNERDYIVKEGNATDPEKYRERLNTFYSGLQEQFGNDPYTSKLIGTVAENHFPSLVAEQTKANNEWRRQQTNTSFRDLLLTESSIRSPDELRKLFNPEVSGLPIEDHKAVVTEALNLSLKGGDNSLAKAFFGGDRSGGINIKDLPPEKAVMAQSIDYVLGVEGGYTGDDAGAGPTNMGINSTANPDIDVKNLTADEARILYEERYWKPVVTPDMSPDMSLVAFDSAVNQGVGFTKKALAESGGDIMKFLQLRHDRYIESSKIPGKEKYLPQWMERLNKLQDAAIAGRPLTKTVDSIVDQKKMVLSLAANGFSEAQIQQISGAYKAATDKKELEFDQNRILTEQSLITQARKEGNLPSRLAQIAETQQANGYSDKWSNEMADKAVAQVNEYDKEQKEFNRIDSVAASGSLANESGDKQKVGIDRERQRIIGKYSAKEGMDKDAKNVAIRQDMTDFLVRNGVVDDMWKKTIATGLSGELIDSKGNISPTALRAYEDYKYLRQNAPAGYAQNYLTGDAGKVVAMAESLDVNMNSDQALLTAAQVISRADSNQAFTNKTVADVDVELLVAKQIEDELNPGFLSFFSRFQAADAFDVKDSDVAAWKNNPALRADLIRRANLIIQSDLSGKTTPGAAVIQAWNDNVNRYEMAPGGNVLFSGKGKTLREELGYPKAHATNLVFKALDMFAANNGKAYFGPKYVGKTENADAQFAKFKLANPDANTTGKDERWVFGKVRDAVSGVHPSTFINDPDRKVVMWQLMKEDEMGNQIPDGDPKPIPYAILGDFMREQDFKQRSERSFSDYAKHAIQDIKQQVVGKD